jgi:hypothetical protein
LLDGIESGGPALAAAQAEAERLYRVNPVFPDPLDAVAAAAGRAAASRAE